VKTNFEKELGLEVDPVALDLLKSFLRLDPGDRMLAKEALTHPFFSMKCWTSEAEQMQHFNITIED
jgi:serine/threonine protein kinase